MDIKKIKTLSFWAGIALFCVVVYVIFKQSDVFLKHFEFDWLFRVSYYDDFTHVAVLSVLASLLIVYGISPTGKVVYKGKCVTSFVIGVSLIIYWIVALIMYRFGIYYINYKNFILLFISAALLVVLGVIFSKNALIKIFYKK